MSFLSSLFLFLIALLPREIRATWLTTTFGLDWPKTKAIDDATREIQKAELTKQLDQLQLDGINTVLFQVRTRCSAVYESPYEPYLYELTGSHYRTPKYDPLQFATEEAHKRGMQLHAWVVCYGLTSHQELRRMGRNSYRNHPTWFFHTPKGVLLNPGVPEARHFLANICGDIVKRYDVDGIHLDYIRYPEKVYRYNDHAQYRRYAKGRSLRKWREDNISATVEEIARKIKTEKPWVALSVSCLGKGEDLCRYKAGSWCAKEHAQDVKKWADRDWIDAVYPMLYADRNHYYPFLYDWKEQLGKTTVVPGIGVYFLTPEYGNRPLRNMQRQIYAAQRLGLGFALFRTEFLLDNVKGCETWIKHLPPAQTLQDEGGLFYGMSSTPTLLPPEIKREGLEELPQPIVKWSISAQNVQAEVQLPQNMRYNVYRKDKKGVQLLHVGLKDKYISLPKPITWHYPQTGNEKQTSYAICLYDRYGRESEASWWRATNE